MSRMDYVNWQEASDDLNSIAEHSSKRVEQMRKGMSCSCEHADDGMVVNWCAAHARVYRKAVEEEREACARLADRVRKRRGQGIIASDVATEIAEAIRNRQ